MTSRTRANAAPSRTRANANPFVTLNVLFLHDVNQDYQVRALDELPRWDVERDMRFQDLRLLVRKLVEKAFKFNVDPETLKFFKPNDPVPLRDSRNWATEHKNDLSDLACQLQYAELLSDVFELENVGKKHLDLIVCGEPGGEEPGEKEDAIGALPTFGPYKRYTALLRNVKKLTPSSAAKSKERETFQKSLSTVIHDGTFAHDRGGNIAVETIAQPIEIFYPPFARITKILEDPTFQPDPVILNAVPGMLSAAGIIGDETKYTANIRPELMKLLNEYIAKVLTTEECSADGIIFKLGDGCLIPLLILELKRALGEGGCDPIVQAEYSVLGRWHENELKTFREKCACPTLILAGGGPNLALLGAVWADRFVVQRLSDIVFVAQASTSVDEQIYKIARFFTAIKTGIADLREYYEKVNSENIKPLEPNDPHPRFFPHPTEFRSRDGERVKFQYMNAIDDNDSRNLTYFVKTVEPAPRNLIVKFSDRYGYEAHQLLATKGCAPKLFYCGLLDGETDVLTSDEAKGRIRVDVGGLYTGPLRMIVMEYLEGENALQKDLKEWPEHAREDIKAAIKLLHENGYVFGDLRPPNVVFTTDNKAKLIDFDWSGKEGEVFYPSGLSKRVGWTDGVESFEKIERRHDLEMLDKHFPVM